jgi:hypothetical protein
MMKILTLACVLLSLTLPFHSAAQTEVEPGVTLTSPVSAVEHTPSGPKITALHPTAIASNAHTGSNVARGLVYSGQHNTIEIPGTVSANILTSAPTFYVRIDPDDPNDLRSEITLLRLKPGKQTRLVLNLTANTFGGGRKRKMDEIPVSKADVPGGWLKITPQSPLAPGEYGLMFLPANPTMFADRVYDFSIPPR